MEILSTLRAAAGGFLSGAEIAQAAGLSRAAIWKQVEELRALGYVIEARPHKGYRLVSVPDRAYPEEVQAGLTTTVYGRKAHYLPAVASTNDEAKRLGALGWPEGTLVVAEYQSAGRGRLGRRWSSPPGGLWFSLIVKPCLALSDLGPLTIVAAVALQRAVRDQTGLETKIKWPNDLVVDGRKLAGILAEASGELGRADLVVIGLGLNVNQEAADFPPEIRPRAVSLRMLAGGTVARVPIVRAFLGHFETLFFQGKQDRYRQALAEASVNSATLGRRVSVATGAGTVEGRALRLDPDGALVIETETGLVRVLSGEAEEAGRHA